MLKKVLIVLSTLVVIVAVLVAFLGYKFSQSGDDYGEQTTARRPGHVKKNSIRRCRGVSLTSQNRILGWVFPLRRHRLATCAGEHLLNLLPGRGHSTLSKLPTVVSRLVLLARAGHGKNTAKPIGSEDCLYLNIFCTEICERESASWR